MKSIKEKADENYPIITMEAIKYWIKIIFLALADISMCECYNNRSDKLENYYR